MVYISKDGSIIVMIMSKKICTPLAKLIVSYLDNYKNHFDNIMQNYELVVKSCVYHKAKSPINKSGLLDGIFLAILIKRYLLLKLDICLPDYRKFMKHLIDINGVKRLHYHRDWLTSEKVNLGFNSKGEQEYKWVIPKRKLIYQYKDKYYYDHTFCLKPCIYSIK